MTASLHDLAVKHGTDKAGHGFCHFYERHLSKWRADPIRLLEIGVYRGSSMCLWREYFPQAEVHGIDIALKGPIDGCTLHQFDVVDAACMSSFVQSNDVWDVVVDDGGHSMKQQQIAFDQLWDRVRSGGIFIVEDLHSSFDENSNERSNPQPTTLEMVRCLEKRGEFSSKWISGGRFDDISKSVEGVEIWNRLPTEHKDHRSVRNSITSVIVKR